MANKRYDQFSTVAPTTSRIILTADPSTGALGKCTVADELALQTSAYTMYDGMRDNGLSVRYPAFGMNPVLGNGTLTFVNGTAYFHAVPVTAFTSTGCFIRLTGAASSVANNFNGLALYENTGSLLNRVAITANDPTIFSGSNNAVRSFPWTASVALSSAVYWLVMVWSASSVTSAPHCTAFTTASVTPGSALIKHTNLTAACTLASQTSLPTTFAFSAAYVDLNFFNLLGIY